MFDLQQDTFNRIVDDLHRSRRLLFVTGAGISADSGLPTYRGIGGLYDERLTEENLPIEVALSGQMMTEAPHIPWKYIHQIEKSCRDARFNDAHRVIVEMQNHFDVWVLTQNVDGFHREAGSLNLIEIHGDIHDLHCTACAYETTVLHYGDLDLPPSCPDCQAVLRPRVVLFGEMLPEHAITLMYEQLGQGFDMVFSIGTTSVFPYIAGPVIAASQAGIPTVEINPGQTTVSHYVDYKISSGAADTLSRIWQLYQETRT